MEMVGLLVDIHPELQVGNAPGTSLKSILTNGAEEMSSPRLERQVAKCYAKIARNAWKAKGRIVASDTGEPKEGMERIYRHVEEILKTLTEEGVEINGHKDDIYDPGMAIKALAFEPTPGITRERIKETIWPTVRYKGHIVLGEVIVGTPIEETDNKEGEHHASDNN